MLQNQIRILDVETGDFYSNNERRLDSIKRKLKREIRTLKEGCTVKLKDGSGRTREIVGVNQIKKSLKEKFSYSKTDFTSLDKDFDIRTIENGNEKKLCELYLLRKSQIKKKNGQLQAVKERIANLLKNKNDMNHLTNGKHHTRILRNDADFEDTSILGENIIAIFESAFTRTVGAEIDEFTDIFMVVNIFYYGIAEDLVNFGFTYRGEKYRYFTSSAGQIRTKKCMFIKESVWQKYEKTIMCGLTVDAINAKGGCNPNKYLAYLALANTATDEWSGFDIDKSIVIGDFETDVEGTYDFINDEDYSIERRTGSVPIPHTDGAGMILPDAFGEKQKNKMVRLPWIKGLLGVFDFKKFIGVGNCPSTVKDIYGTEHDIIDEDIQVIFTESQFKMAKYYDSWEQYKELYKKYGCAAGVANVEKDRIKDTTINYQMLQTLTDITDEEIEKIASTSVYKLNHVCDSVENMMKFFGITPYNEENLTPYQKAVRSYPDLMNDEFFKAMLRERIKSVVKKCKAGHLAISGKYTFVLPDFYAACEYWFKGIKNPKGLLDDGEVFCWLFRKSDRLDCLRSPHLYREHAIRKNVAFKGDERQTDLREWFATDAIYTSTHDLISKLLMFDVDGDTLLVVSDKSIIDVAERNMEGVVPLHYNMKKANPSEIGNETIYKGLHDAFSASNIGTYSNNISKIWNSKKLISGNGKNRDGILGIIKLLVTENNFKIDYAKTLYEPERPKRTDEKIKEFTRIKELPHFFIYAKDKGKGQVADANGSLVNKLEGIIPIPRINTRQIGLKEIDYRLLMHNPDIEFDESDELIACYDRANRQYRYKYESVFYSKRLKTADRTLESEKDEQTKKDIEQKIFDDIKSELLECGHTETEVTDILVKYVYGKRSKHKNLLWFTVGEQIYKNLSENIERLKDSKRKMVQCDGCGEWFEIPMHDESTCRCGKCDAKNGGKNKKAKKEKSEQTVMSFDKPKKLIQCSDCGIWFEIPNRGRGACRCDECKKEYRNNYQKILMRKRKMAEKKAS